MLVDIFNLKDIISCKCKNSDIVIIDSKNNNYIISEIELTKILQSQQKYVQIITKNNEKYLESLDY